MHKNQYIDKKIPIITRIIGILWNIEVSNSGVGTDITIKKFVRFETGEGLEKKQDDFAAEVAAQLG